MYMIYIYMIYIYDIYMIYIYMIYIYMIYIYMWLYVCILQIHLYHPHTIWQKKTTGLQVPSRLKISLRARNKCDSCQTAPWESRPGKMKHGETGCNPMWYIEFSGVPLNTRKPGRHRSHPAVNGGRRLTSSCWNVDRWGFSTRNGRENSCDQRIATDFLLYVLGSKLLVLGINSSNLS